MIPTRRSRPRIRTIGALRLGSPGTADRRRFAVAVAVLLSACGAGPSGPSEGLYADIHTTKGVIVARLEPERTPLATAGFVGLAEGTIENAAFDRGRPFYDGTVFHRVVPGHVIQAGAPDSERADGPGYTFPNEIHAALSHDHAGALGVANAGPHTNGSQFYVTLGDRSYLDGDYIVFGGVVEGMDVVGRIEQGDIVDSVRIRRVGESAEAFRPDTERFREMVRAADRRVAEVAERKRAAEREWIAEHWPDATGPEDGVLIARRGAGSRADPDAGSTDAGDAPAAADAITASDAASASDASNDSGARAPLRVRYRGTAVRYVGHLLGYDGPEFEETSFGSGDDGAPGFIDPPRTFVFDPGETAITPGLDSVVVGIAPGERVVAIVPPELGYGRGGFYAPPVPGEPRFVISPNTLLVYEIEVLAEAAGGVDAGGR